ncbi:serine/threonine protein phosphatase [Mycobacterium sp. IS-1496]|uniref:PP2C family protein-serine/threonine phosphatase n=1 Tax=Mycobacterium sp. IS-1496 TaxID=1772284 RepID=UPI000741672D|nr:GAF domain-containing SpoIIE family protein phosphatase [Mycobacterium sp. IS-1496]KUI26409.1 serine/threonine protein phosphatase [Mycobacterium sp. IS-1496]
MPRDIATAAPSEPARSRAQLTEDVEIGLAGTLNLRRTGLRLLTLLRPELADWAALVLPDNRTGGVTFFGGDRIDFTDLVPRQPEAYPLLERTLRTGQPHRVRLGSADAGADALAGIVHHPRLCEEVASRSPADVLALGLTARGATLGALLLARVGDRGFGDDDIVFAQRLASRAAVALDSARLYEERGRIAAALQRGLRPPVLPEVEGMRVAARYRPTAEHLEIGGDFYDVHGAAGDWLFTLGDVCGKGVEAAALTGRTRQSIRTAAHFDRRPEVVLGALNSVLHDAEADQFVTVVCARVRPHPGGHADVDLAVAGHPAPIVLRADGRVEQLEVFGTAAGMRAQTRYRPGTVQLDRGDTLLMYTDGVDEARGDPGFYGVDRLLGFLPAYAGAAPDVVCEAVEQHVLEFLDGRPHDDIALLAVTCGT